MQMSRAGKVLLFAVAGVGGLFLAFMLFGTWVEMSDLGEFSQDVDKDAKTMQEFHNQWGAAIGCGLRLKDALRLPPGLSHLDADSRIQQMRELADAAQKEANAAQGSVAGHKQWLFAAELDAGRSWVVRVNRSNPWYRSRWKHVNEEVSWEEKELADDSCSRAEH